MDTQISLSAELKERLEREANTRGMSIAEFVRELLERGLGRKVADDPMFADTAVYRDDGPNDLASNHDQYLYGDAS